MTGKNFFIFTETPPAEPGFIFQDITYHITEKPITMKKTIKLNLTTILTAVGLAAFTVPAAAVGAARFQSCRYFKLDELQETQKRNGIVT